MDSVIISMPHKWSVFFQLLAAWSHTPAMPWHHPRLLLSRPLRCGVGAITYTINVLVVVSNRY